MLRCFLEDCLYYCCCVVLKADWCLLQLEKLKESLHSAETQIEQLNSQLLRVWQEKDIHIQEISTHQKMLQQCQDKVNENLLMSGLLFIYLGLSQYRCFADLGPGAGGELESAA